MKPFLHRLRWIGGTVLPWFILWLLLGLRVLSSIKATPHPLLKGVKLTGIMVEAASEWAIKALLAYLFIGLLLGLITKLSTSDAQGHNLSKHLGFKSGLITGLGTLIYFHAVLYTRVPMGLVGITLLNRLPIGLVLVGLLALGAYFLWRTVRDEADRFRLVRWGTLLVLIALLPSIPHDLFRRRMNQIDPLPPDAPRVLVLGIDGFRRDTFEALRPDWKAPEGLNPVCVAPATRRSWSYLFGKDPEELKVSIVMPFKSDLSQPDSFQLLSEANKRGYRMAWAIDDSLTASFGYQLGFFSTAREAPGGWKYWFSLGLGTTWPAWTWMENYTTEIETTNAWSETDYYWRDIGRLLEGHHLVFAHSCFAHEPIRLKFGELRSVYGWKWLMDGIYHYRPCFSEEEVQQENGYRADLRSSALDHYVGRLHSGADALAPHLTAWSQEYPNLSGLLTSDHGEQHVPALGKDGRPVTYLEGIHGYTLEPLATWVPFHGFGKTTLTYRPGDLFSWLELRDALQQWLQRPGPLALKGRSTPLFFQFPTMRTVQQEKDDVDARVKESGLDPRDLAKLVYLQSNGVWYAPDEARRSLAEARPSVGWAEGDRLVLFNPSSKGHYIRSEFRGYVQLKSEEITESQVAMEAAPYIRFSPHPYGSRPPQ